MPVDIQAGDYIMVFCGSVHGSTGSAPPGWSKLTPTPSVSTVCASVFAKQADGSEGGAVVTFPLVESGSSSISIVLVYRRGPGLSASPSEIVSTGARFGYSGTSTYNSSVAPNTPTVEGNFIFEFGVASSATGGGFGFAQANQVLMTVGPTPPYSGIVSLAQVNMGVSGSSLNVGHTTRPAGTGNTGHAYVGLVW